MRHVHLLASLAVAALLLGCSADRSADEAAPAAVPDSDAAAVTGVAWFEGSIDDAFATAKRENKPLFLYWGAEWCPYCKVLQANIFIRDEFVRMSRQFVAVDMSNGDSTTIRYADEFKIYGLPTVIVFSPEGRELTRIPGGMDMERYAGVLALTLNQVRPVAELVGAALDGEALRPEDWQLLANYSWTQDRGQALGEDHPEQVLLQLRDAAPEADARTRARLGLAALAVWLRQPEDTRDAALAEAHLAHVESVLADPGYAADNLMPLAALGGDVVSLAEGEQQRRLQEDLLALYRPAIEDAGGNLLNRASILSGWAEVVTATLDEATPAPPAAVEWGRRHADAMVPALDAYQVHAGIYSLWGVYYDLGLEAEARRTLQVGIDRSKAPFYFMSSMGYIEREAGNNAAALDWYRRAWEATANPLDRARWGSGYLQQVVKLAPEDAVEIERAGAALMDDLLSQPEALAAYERSLQRLRTVLAEWAADSTGRQAVAGRVLAGLEAQCAGIAVTQESPAACNPASDV